MTGPNGDSTSEGAQMVVGYTVQDEPLQVVPNPHHDGIDYISTSWDPLSYMVTNYDPAHNFVPIDTITVYSMNYLHYDDCRSNFICKGITVPPNSRLVFKACMPDSVDVMFQLDSLTIYGDYMSPDSMVAHKDTICAGSSYEGYGFSLPTILNPGTFVFEQWECVGNRSILHQLTLTVKTRKTSYFSYTISPGETVFFEDSTFTEAGSYTFNYTGFNGCDSVVILHISYDWQGVENSIWVPSAFTPNGDGLNDVFMPVFAYPERVDAYRLEIYDRIGSMIFATRRKDVGWDGGGCPDGVYPYIIRYSFLGETRQEKRGTVVLVH
ncbi:MAG: gliding motility-associated C-terminal domain-containing protein [Bacteroidales bacterium]|nr:gliding motility-associated C-terminal domain-containing protein [Bacteroidales bacterium]